MIGFINQAGCQNFGFCRIQRPDILAIIQYIPPVRQLDRYKQTLSSRMAHYDIKISSWQRLLEIGHWREHYWVSTHCTCNTVSVCDVLPSLSQSSLNLRKLETSVWNQWNTPRQARHQETPMGWNEPGFWAWPSHFKNPSSKSDAEIHQWRPTNSFLQILTVMDSVFTLQLDLSFPLPPLLSRSIDLWFDHNYWHSIIDHYKVMEWIAIRTQKYPPINIFSGRRKGDRNHLKLVPLDKIPNPTIQIQVWRWPDELRLPLVDYGPLC